jgi:hypothetical protein
METTTVVNIT